MRPEHGGNEWSCGRRVGAAALTLAILCAAPAVAQGSRAPRPRRPPAVPSAIASTRQSPATGLHSFDSRDAGASVQAPASVAAARAQLGASLGKEAAVTSDPATGALRSVGKLDGYLTGPTNQSAAHVALGYVRQNHQAFGIPASDVGSLRQVGGFSDHDGTRHVSFVQYSQGVPVFGAGLKAAVAGNGRLLNVVQGPVPNAATKSPTPHVSAADAVRAALRNGGAKDTSPGHVVSTKNLPGTVDTSVFSTGNRASLVDFPTASGGHIAWLVNAYPSSTASYIDVVDASSGQILLREDTTSFDVNSDAQAWQYYPSNLLPAGVGSQGLVHFPISGNGSALTGNNAHTYADPLDSIQVPGGTVPAGDEIPKTGNTVEGYAFNYTPTLDNGSTGWPGDSGDFHYFGLANCDPRWECTWDFQLQNSWQTNLKQNATQVYYYVNNYHDWLQNNPHINFGPAQGNFQVSNAGQGGVGGDAVQAQVDDGANTGDASGNHSPGGGYPDYPNGSYPGHIDNANMAAQQDGIPPRMQMYLFVSGTMNGGINPDANGGDEADVVYHEYTHGLSHRLVTFSNGVPALISWQPNMMGEAWSDWYAMDYLDNQGYDADTSAIGDVQIGYFAGGGTTIRTEPMDCPADGSTHGGVCPGTSGAGPGGYTYGDMSHVIGQPEVHADGEIWGQTLEQIRERLIAANGGNQVTGSGIAEKLITEAMEISPPDPSFLDMRNAILQADKLAYGGAHQTLLWQVFANRGMGFFADAADSNDTTPTQNFSTPPSCPSQCTTLSGTITDADSHAAVNGVSVGIRSHDSGFAGDLRATTNSAGHYSISNVPKSHSYALQIAKAGYLPATPSVAVGAGATTSNHAITRDWVATSGGAHITASTAPNYGAFGCGPSQAIDLSQSAGWGSNTPTNTTDATGQGQHIPTGPRSITIHLPKKIDIRQFRMDPGSTCGDPANAGVKAFTVQTRTSATAAWKTAWNNTAARAEHTFTPFNPTTAKTGITDVKLTMKSSRGNPDFMDMSEFEVFGR